MSLSFAALKFLQSKGLTLEDVTTLGELMGAHGRASVGVGGPYSDGRTYPTYQEIAAYDCEQKRAIYYRALKDPVYAEGDGYYLSKRLPDRDWWPLVGSIRRRDGHACIYCGVHGEGVKLHCDHVVPLSRGGDNSPGNLVTACAFCNTSKGAKLLLDWSVPAWLDELRCPA